MEETKENENKNGNDSLVADLIEGQKNDKKFYKIMIFVLIGIIVVQSGYILAQSIYHDYKWLQFDTIVVDGGEGGDANYIGNDGDINNYGESNGTQEKTNEQR